MKDLIVLLADKDAEFSMRGILTNPQRLGIREINFDLVADRQGKDPGVFRRCHEFLRSSLKMYQYALVIFDRDGCGGSSSREQLELEAERRLSQNGWDDRRAVIAIDPELEIWVWSDSPHVRSVLGWHCSAVELRKELEERGYLQRGHCKPRQPKKAFDHVLRLSKRQRSSALFEELAQRVNFQGCVDPAFLKLGTTLQRWFPKRE